MDFSSIKGERLRRLAAVVSMLVTVFYLHWRVTQTLNPDARFFSWALYGAEVFGAITTFLFYFSVWRPTNRKSPPPLEGRTVDVFVPTLSESTTVLRKTLLSCNDLKYPHRTLVLDDGNRPEVKALCEELGCVYLARTSHEGAKAGNLNFGLQHSTAEFITVFDADHAPLPRLIDRLIGYFTDEKVAFVQTPQEFYNIDSFQHRVDKQHKYIWGEQYLFFSLIQPGRDRWNAAYFVGSCAMLRRKAIDDVGGFATGSITEDLLTSIHIHAKGWSSVYHNENLAYGIAAETIEPFHIQRLRWGIGGWQVFFKKNPLFVRGLTLPQRLCYFASLIYPVEGLQKLIFYVTPPIVLFTGVLPMRALDVNYLLHFVPYYALSLFAFNEMARGFGGNIMLEQFSMGKFATYLRTTGGIFRPRRGPRFHVTPKGEHKPAPYGLVAPQTTVLAVSLCAIIFALVQLVLGRRDDDFIIAVNSLWALYNSGLGLAIIQHDLKKLVQRRESIRIEDAVPVLYRKAGADTNHARLAVADDLTKKGLSMLSIDEIGVGEEVALQIVLPARTLLADGKVIRGKSKATDGRTISRVGVSFTELPAGQADTMSRYLAESAVTKFMGEYTTRYQTYVERKMSRSEKRRKRAERFVAYLPVAVRTENDEFSYGVLKNVSATGAMLVSRDLLTPGDQVILDVALGEERIALAGVVVRILEHQSDEFPEMFVGIRFNEGEAEKVESVLTVCEGVGELLSE